MEPEVGLVIFLLRAPRKNLPQSVIWISWRGEENHPGPQSPSSSSAVVMETYSMHLSKYGQSSWGVRQCPYRNYERHKDVCDMLAVALRTMRQRQKGKKSQKQDGQWEVYKSHQILGLGK